MDLKDLTPSSETTEVTIVHPATLEMLVNNDKSPMTITMHSPHSKAYKSAIYEQTDKRLKKAQGKKSLEITAEELEDAAIELLAKTTKDWNITFDGEQPNFTVSKAKSIYSEVFWLREQIEEALNNSLDFMKV
jgi:membrane-associated HD superfamily phosphohydrolase